MILQKIDGVIRVLYCILLPTKIILWISKTRTITCLQRSLRARVHVQAPDKILFTLLWGLDPRSSEAIAILVACSGDHVNRQLWACTLHNLRQTRTSTCEEIATFSDELGHGWLRQKSLTWTQISVPNTKHQFTCFYCVRAQTRMLGASDRDLRCSINAPSHAFTGQDTHHNLPSQESYGISVVFWGVYRKYSNKTGHGLDHPNPSYQSPLGYPDPCSNPTYQW